MSSMRVLLGLSVTSLLALPARADAPPEIPLQGRLTDAAGAPIDGDVEVRFAIYATEAGGEALFSESQIIHTEGGELVTSIGAMSALELAMFRDHGELYLGIAVGSEPEMTPRFPLGSVPYAAFAAHAGDSALLGGRSAADFAWSDHDHDFGDLGGLPASLLDGDDDTLYSAGAGLSLDGTVFGVDTAVMQRRVTGACEPGASIRAIAGDGTVECEADDDTDTLYSAGAGLSLDGTVFGVDTAVTQRRVTGACEPGTSIRAIAGDGTVECEADDDTDTSYSAGAGLSLAGTVFGVAPGPGIAVASGAVATDPTYVQRRISASCAAGSAITAIHEDGTVDCGTASAPSRPQRIRFTRSMVTSDSSNTVSCAFNSNDTSPLKNLP
jgi:hypothetical protein